MLLAMTMMSIMRSLAMQTAVRVGLWIHVLAEGIAGMILLLRPSMFDPDASFEHREAMRGFGNGAIAVGLVGVAILAKGEKIGPAADVLYAIIATYHCVIVALQCRSPMKGAPVWLAPLFHGALASLFWAAFAGERQLLKQE